MNGPPNIFVVAGIVKAAGIKPTIILHKDPFIEGKYIATFEGIDTDEIVNGYTYDELLSIRNTITEALTGIDVKETVWEYNKNYPKYTHHDV